MGGPSIFLLVLAYIALLFFVAWRADEPRKPAVRPHSRALIYALSLAVLCSSWTYFGAVGQAAGGSWLYVANFLGPILAITLGFPIWRRIAVLTKSENVGSIADFISARYGKSRALGSLVACVAIIGALPYIALQFISLTKAWAFAAGLPAPPAMGTPILVAALATFAILFGARRPSLTERSRGLTSMVALESVVKLSGLLAAAALCVALLLRDGGVSAPAGGSMPRLDMGISFVTATFLCAVTTLTLPRQFHLSFVTLEDVDDLRTARWVTPLYFALWTLAILPIALAARALLSGSSVDPDMLILALVTQNGGAALTALVFLGGFSAGAAMVVVETTALSVMISNDIVLPWLARRGWRPRPDFDAGRAIVNIRRVVIVVIHLLGWLYCTALNDSGNLGKLGFTSLTASTQLLPALVGGVLWRRGHMKGAVWGIVGGMAVWFVAVVGPQIVAVDTEALLATTPLGFLPGSLFEQGIICSLALNVFLYVAISLRTTPRLVDTVQANIFVAAGTTRAPNDNAQFSATVGDLRALVRQFIGAEEENRAFAELARSSLGRLPDDDEPASPLLARATERMLSGIIGASSARTMVALRLAAGARDAAEVSQILDEAAHAVQFSRELLQTTLESLDNGIGLVDREMRLIAWNARYVQMLQLPMEAIWVGKPFEEILDHVERSVEAASQSGRRAFVDERLRAIAGRAPTVIERRWRDGRVLKITGTPLASGEYLTSIADITDAVMAARALTDMNEALEARVQTRTRELTQVNQALAQATDRAEKVTRSQRRFVAAASHDLLQPLHAARLFLGSAMNDLPADAPERDLIAKSDLSIEAADRLLRALMNLSRLEVDGLRPAVRQVSILALFTELKREYETPAALAGLELVVLPAAQAGLSDPDLLRSVLQNLLSNAIRYTRTGRVVLACRRAAEGALRIEVRDTGPGISRDMQTVIFDEFVQLGPAAGDRGGAGLGLAISRRICEALGHDLSVRSEPGAGSTFAVTLPMAVGGDEALRPVAAREALNGLRVLCVEDDPYIREATAGILKRWGAEVETAAEAGLVLETSRTWDVALADYSLGGAVDGLMLLRALGARARIKALVTANPGDEVAQAAAELGAVLIRKPMSPAALADLMRTARRASDADD